MKTVAIVGNGILGLQTAYRLLREDQHVGITLIGPATHPGSASLAAAAMLHAFCEVDTLTLQNPGERSRFLLNKTCNDLWPALIAEVRKESRADLPSGFGTFLVTHAPMRSIEAQNFEAVISALNLYREPYEAVRLEDIPNYRPASVTGESRAIYIPREGWIQPAPFLKALETLLVASGRVRIVNGWCRRLIMSSNNEQVETIELLSGEQIGADQVVLCPGANFTQIIENSRLPFTCMRVFYGVGATLVLSTGDLTLHTCIRTANRGTASGLYAVPHGDRQTLIGATTAISAMPVDQPAAESISALLKAAHTEIHQGYEHAELLGVNVGWRPVSADTLPLLGRTAVTNLVVATGTNRDGFHGSPVISTALVDLLLKGDSHYDLTLFDPQRVSTPVYSLTEGGTVAGHFKSH